VGTPYRGKEKKKKALWIGTYRTEESISPSLVEKRRGVGVLSLKKGGRTNGFSTNSWARKKNVRTIVIRSD